MAKVRLLTSLAIVFMLVAILELILLIVVGGEIGKRVTASATPQTPAAVAAGAAQEK